MRLKYVTYKKKETITSLIGDRLFRFLMKTPRFAELFLNILFEGKILDVNERKEISYISDSILLVTGK